MFKHRQRSIENIGLTAIVTARLGNIVEQPDCDAIVNSANPSLRAGSGVCGAIHKAAGPELERHAVHFAPLELAQAIATPGFNLPNRLVIHCRGPRYHFDPDPPGNLAQCIENVLWLAEREGVKRIAIPAISMGVYGFPIEEAVPILVDKTLQLSGKCKILTEIRFVLTSELFLRLFQKLTNDI